MINKLRHFSIFLLFVLALNAIGAELIINIEFFAPVLHYPLYLVAIILIGSGVIIQNETQIVPN
jgi:hypothetical protein